jgi:hypothetical protein
VVEKERDRVSNPDQQNTPYGHGSTEVEKANWRIKKPEEVKIRNIIPEYLTAHTA